MFLSWVAIILFHTGISLFELTSLLGKSLSSVTDSEIFCDICPTSFDVNQGSDFKGDHFPLICRIFRKREQIFCVGQQKHSSCCDLVLFRQKKLSSQCTAPVDKFHPVIQALVISYCSGMHHQASGGLAFCFVLEDLDGTHVETRHI